MATGNRCADGHAVRHFGAVLARRPLCHMSGAMGDVRRLGGSVGEEHANSWSCRRLSRWDTEVGQEHPIRRRSSTLGTNTLPIITRRRDRYRTTYHEDRITAVVLLNHSISHRNFCAKTAACHIKTIPLLFQHHACLYQPYELFLFYADRLAWWHCDSA